MGIKVTRDQGITISMSSLVSIAASLSAVWAFAAPIAQSAFAGEIKEQMAPLRGALEISTQSSIRQLRTAISVMNFKREMCSGVTGCWNVSDQRDLDQAIADLETAEEVLKSLRASK